MEIYTVQISQWRNVKTLGIDFVDITAKSGNRVFAPHYHVLMEYKRGLHTWASYTSLYRTKMRISVVEHAEEWMKLSKHKKIALACYCRPGELCHRHLFRQYFAAYLKSIGVPSSYMGEITKEGIHSPHSPPI